MDRSIEGSQSRNGRMMTCMTSNSTVTQTSRSSQMQPPDVRPRFDPQSSTALRCWSSTSVCGACTEELEAIASQADSRSSMRYREVASKVVGPLTLRQTQSWMQICCCLYTALSPCILLPVRHSGSAQHGQRSTCGL